MRRLANLWRHPLMHTVGCIGLAVAIVLVSVLL